MGHTGIFGDKWIEVVEKRGMTENEIIGEIISRKRNIKTKLAGYRQEASALIFFSLLIARRADPKARVGPALAASLLFLAYPALSGDQALSLAPHPLHCLPPG